MLFGSTWLVNSLVFFAILCSVMLAVFLSSRFPIRPSLAAVRAAGGDAVACVLRAPGRVPVHRQPGGALRAGQPGRVLPVFVANLVFAGSFKGTGMTADIAFASNLIGIMLGGALEYASLLIGYQNLLLIVIGFYVLSAVLLRPREPAPQTEADDSRVPVAAT